jgi:hypothetical protein
VDDITCGIIIDDVYFPPSQVLVEAIRESERHYGVFPRHDEKGQRIHGPDPRFGNGELMRAAILKRP